MVINGIQKMALLLWFFAILGDFLGWQLAACKASALPLSYAPPFALIITVIFLFGNVILALKGECDSSWREDTALKLFSFIMRP